MTSFSAGSLELDKLFAAKKISSVQDFPKFFAKEQYRRSQTHQFGEVIFFSLYGNNLICCTNSQLNWPYHQWSNGWCSGIPTFRCSGLREWRFTTIRFSLRRHSYSGKLRINRCSLLQSKGHQTCNCALREGQWFFRIFFYSKTSTFLRLI